MSYEEALKLYFEDMERANRIGVTAIHKELAGILRYYLGASKKTFEW